LILFCAINPLNNPIKGWKTVYETMQHLEVTEPGKYSIVICDSDKEKIPALWILLARKYS